MTHLPSPEERLLSASIQLNEAKREVAFAKQALAAVTKQLTETMHDRDFALARLRLMEAKLQRERAGHLRLVTP
jgi:hypothetical protein